MLVVAKSFEVFIFHIIASRTVGCPSLIASFVVLRILLERLKDINVVAEADLGIVHLHKALDPAMRSEPRVCRTEMSVTPGVKRN